MHSVNKIHKKEKRGQAPMARSREKRACRVRGGNSTIMVCLGPSSPLTPACPLLSPYVSLAIRPHFPILPPALSARRSKKSIGDASSAAWATRGKSGRKPRQENERKKKKKKKRGWGKNKHGGFLSSSISLSLVLYLHLSFSTASADQKNGVWQQSR